MKLLRKAMHGFNSYMTFLARARTRDVLLRSSDRMLEDAGFSRELLESGVPAWPWRKPAMTLLKANPRRVAQITAIRELQAYSDRDLHDLGISRGSIPEAVLFGREGIDHEREQRAA